MNYKNALLQQERFEVWDRLSKTMRMWQQRNNRETIVSEMHRVHRELQKKRKKLSRKRFVRLVETMEQRRKSARRENLRMSARWNRIKFILCKLIQIHQVRSALENSIEEQQDRDIEVMTTVACTVQVAVGNMPDDATLVFPARVLALRNARGRDPMQDMFVMFVTASFNDAFKDKEEQRIVEQMWDWPDLLLEKATDGSKPMHSTARLVHAVRKYLRDVEISLAAEFVPVSWFNAETFRASVVKLSTMQLGRVRTWASSNMVICLCACLMARLVMEDVVPDGEVVPDRKLEWITHTLTLACQMCQSALIKNNKHLECIEEGVVAPQLYFQHSVLTGTTLGVEVRGLQQRFFDQICCQFALPRYLV